MNGLGGIASIETSLSAALRACLGSFNFPFTYDQFGEIARMNFDLLRRRDMLLTTGHISSPQWPPECGVMRRVERSIHEA
jgi:hypothetical protein